MKAIQTEYKGYKFRSRLEARWAVFFDACGVNWEYEPEGYYLGDGLCYLPDFLLHNVHIKCTGDPIDIFVEVKGVMTTDDCNKINKFICGERVINLNNNPSEYLSPNPTLIVGNIPEETETGHSFFYNYVEEGELPPFNFMSIDSDCYTAYPGVNTNGDFVLFGGDYMDDFDEDKTSRAYCKARQARFEHGEKPLK